LLLSPKLLLSTSGDGSLLDTSHLIDNVQKVLMKTQQSIQNIELGYWTMHLLLGMLPFDENSTNKQESSEA